MPLMPLALDIYVKSLQLKASKPRVIASTNTNEAGAVSEAKLALRDVQGDTKPLTVVI
jgi:hypothetical protein